MSKKPTPTKSVRFRRARVRLVVQVDEPGVVKVNQGTFTHVAIEVTAFSESSGWVCDHRTIEVAKHIQALLRRHPIKCYQPFSVGK